MDDDHPSTSTNLEIDQLSPISLDPVNELKEELPPTQLQISSSSPYESTPSSSLSIAPLFSHSTSTRKTYSTSPISYQRRSSLIGSQEDANLELSDEGGSFTLAGLDSLDPSSVESSHASLLQRQKRFSDATSENENVEQSKKRLKLPPDCCMVCSESKTVEWRKGPAGNRSLCNGCGLQAAKRVNERKVRGTPEPVTLKEIETEIRHIGEDRFSSRGQTFTLPSNLADRISGNLSRTKQDEAIKANMVQLKVDKQAAVSLLGLAKPPQRSRSAGPIASTSVSIIHTLRDCAQSHETNYSSSDFLLNFPPQSPNSLPRQNFDQFPMRSLQYSTYSSIPQSAPTVILPPQNPLEISLTPFVQSSRRMSIDYISPTIDSTEPVFSNFFEETNIYRDAEKQGRAGSDRVNELP